MRGFYAVFTKELANFFVSPIAYALIVGFLTITGFIFWMNVAYMGLLSMQAAGNPMFAERINVTDFVLKPIMQNMGFIMLFVVPLLTMRLFSEEKKSGTIELILTYPITDTAVLAAKFLAAAVVLAAMLAGMAPSLLLLYRLSEPDTGVLISGYLGLILMGLAFLALGAFISSITENQIIAAATSFALALLFWVANWLTSILEGTAVVVVKQLSMLEHLESFTKGIISAPDVSYFLLFTAFFLFMTMRSLESYRWRG
jgi:ABC-2 type transport system permease protein